MNIFAYTWKYWQRRHAEATNGDVPADQGRTMLSSAAVNSSKRRRLRGRPARQWSESAEGKNWISPASPEGSPRFPGGASPREFPNRGARAGILIARGAAGDRGRRAAAILACLRGEKAGGGGEPSSYAPSRVHTSRLLHTYVERAAPYSHLLSKGSIRETCTGRSLGGKAAAERAAPD